MVHIKYKGEEILVVLMLGCVAVDVSQARGEELI